MITVKLKMPDGFVRELKVQEVIEIDGRPFNPDSMPDLNNHEIRLRNCEQHIHALMNFLDDKFPSSDPSPQNVPT